MWRADISAPFTKPSWTKNPPPGYYFKKQHEDVKQRLLQEETVTVPFGSREERPVNKPSKELGPGPGNYIDISNPAHSSVCRKLAKIEEERNNLEQNGVSIGGFGSNTERNTFWMAPKRGPAPGEYEIEDMADATTPLEVTGKPQRTRVQTAVSRERKKPHSVF